MTNKAIVLFGATGDLAQRMLYPSLFHLESDGLLPEALTIVGTARAPLTPSEFTAKTRNHLIERTGDHFCEAVWVRLEKKLRYVSGSADAPNTYKKISTQVDGAGEFVFYLSTSPSLYGVIAKNLATAGLAHSASRVIVEKPLGRDYESCKEINDSLAAIFSEDRIFRIDHYLGKETVQNLLALRFANTLFEPLWSKISVEHVQITIAETVGVEERWSYYNDYGALRDMVQNHLLQLLCLVAMEPPASDAPDAVRDEKVKVLRSLRSIPASDVSQHTVRGQYIKGVADGETVPGYGEEPGGGDSDTETFVAISAYIDNWRWAGVPFYLRTGKRMPSRETQIAVQFRNVPHSIFQDKELQANRLIIKLQPDEKISLTLMNKAPSLLDAGGMQLSPVALNLSVDEADQEQFPRRRIAYERLLLEAINNNPTLFVRRDEAETAWTWIDGIVDGWQRQSQAPSKYPAGVWGPSGAHALTERNGHSWIE